MRENLDELGHFPALVPGVARADRMLDAMGDVVAQDLVLDLLERGLHRLDLIEDVDAVAVLADHAGDAVIVAVSEETGMISHAYKGQLVRGVTLEELRAFLTSVLVQPAKSRRGTEWLRARFGERPKPGPEVITKNEPRPALKQAGH